MVWDPHKPNGGLTAAAAARRPDDPVEGALLGARPVHRECVDDVRERVPGVQVLVHPECTHEVVTKADLVGSTEFIIKTIEAAPPGSSWAIGTELNLVQRLAQRAPRQEHRVPRQDRLLLLDDEPHRPAALRLGAGEPGRRRRGQPDRGRPGDRELGARSRCSGCSTCRRPRKAAAQIRVPTAHPWERPRRSATRSEAGGAPERHPAARSGSIGRSCLSRSRTWISSTLSRCCGPGRARTGRTCPACRGRPARATAPGRVLERHQRAQQAGRRTPGPPARC